MMITKTEIPPLRPSTRVHEIDLLRFCAALSVVFFHYAFRGYAADNMSIMPYPLLAPIAKYGFLGVELFFLISGFVILMTALNGGVRSFAISRVARLYPAFWVCSTATFLLILAMGETRFSASVGQYFANLTMLSGFLGIPHIDGVYGSLYIELRFYFLVALVLAIGRIHQAQWFLTLWLIASIALEILPIGKLRYLLIVDYSAYFIAGATCYLVWFKGLSLGRVCVIISAMGLALYHALKSLPGIEKHYDTTISGLVVSGIIMAMFGVMFMVSLRRTGFFGNNRWRAGGALTYPLYLLHQNIGFMIFNAAYPAINPHLLFWGTIVGMLVAAYAVNILIEKRFSAPMKKFIDISFCHFGYLIARICESATLRSRSKH